MEVRYYQLKLVFGLLLVAVSGDLLREGGRVEQGEFGPQVVVQIAEMFGFFQGRFVQANVFVGGEGVEFVVGGVVTDAPFF